MQKEIFKQIPGFEDYYVSNLGNLKSLKWNKEKIKIPSIDNRTGYKYSCLIKNNTRKKFCIHQLVAIVFLDHKPNGMESVIDHINSDKTDNRLENLRIISFRENKSKISEHPNKTSKYIGVDWYKPISKWRARIVINGKKKYLGCFDTELEAHEAYQKALSEL